MKNGKNINGKDTTGKRPAEYYNQDPAKCRGCKNCLDKYPGPGFKLKPLGKKWCKFLKTWVSEDQTGCDHR